MKLSDGGIFEQLRKGNIKIEPLDVDLHKDMEEQIYNSKQIQPASVDLRLDSELLVYNDIEEIDTKNMPEPDERRTGSELYLNEGEFALASTKEHLRIARNISAEVKGRSSVGRAGFHIHTAGWVDPGFEGDITLELVNHAPATVRLHEDMRICQVVFDEISSPAIRAYGEKKDAKYQGQKGATASRLQEDFDK